MSRCSQVLTQEVTEVVHDQASSAKFAASVGLCETRICGVLHGARHVGFVLCSLMILVFVIACHSF